MVVELLEGGCWFRPGEALDRRQRLRERDWICLTMIGTVARQQQIGPPRSISSEGMMWFSIVRDLGCRRNESGSHRGRDSTAQQVRP